MAIFASFLCPAFPASRVQQVSDMHSNAKATPCVQVCHTMCGSRDKHNRLTSNQRSLSLGEEKRRKRKKKELEYGPMPNVVAALPNIVGALCSMPQSLADVHY